jgi:hypothetical protein
LVPVTTFDWSSSLVRINANWSSTFIVTCRLVRCSCASSSTQDSIANPTDLGSDLWVSRNQHRSGSWSSADGDYSHDQGKESGIKKRNRGGTRKCVGGSIWDYWYQM